MNPLKKPVGVLIPDYSFVTPKDSDTTLYIQVYPRRTELWTIIHKTRPFLQALVKVSRIY